jgi:predicted RNA-binding Zn-ribbon protein involved in translation (DUF1610 family)
MSPGDAFGLGEHMVACPTCGKDLTYIKEYDRYYCYAEARYAPKGYEAAPAAAPEEGAAQTHEGHYHCPSCGRELTFIEQYGRYYCYPEQTYAPKDLAPVGGAPPTEEPKAAEPVTEAPAVEPTPEVPAEPAPAAAEPTPAVVGPTPAAEEPAKEEPTAEAAPVAEPEPTPTVPAAPFEDARPGLARSAVTKAKKSKLMEWCSAYGLDPLGTRTVLRDRLLQYMDDHDLDITKEEEASILEESVAEVAPALTSTPAAEVVTPEPAPEPVAEEPKAEPIPEPVKEEPVAEPTPAPVVMPEALPAAAPIEAPKVELPAVVPEPAPAPSPAPAAPPAVEVKVEKPLPCPTCGKDLTYLAKYDRLYCYACGNYAPKAYGKEPPPEPARPIAVVEVPKPAEPAVAAPAPRVEAKGEAPCPTCGKELTFVKDYSRWYCYAEGKYAPKDYAPPRRGKNPCPTCGRELAWIPAYARWYCYAEAKYAPRTMAAPAVAVAVPQVRVEVAAPAVSEARVVALEQARHVHKRPTAGLAMVAVGMILFLLAQLFVYTALLAGVNLLASLGPVGAVILLITFDVGGILLIAGGVLAGLSALRSR